MLAYQTRVSDYIFTSKLHKHMGFWGFGEAWDMRMMGMTTMGAMAMAGCTLAPRLVWS